LKTKAAFAEDMSLTEIGKDTRFRWQALTGFTLGPFRHRPKEESPATSVGGPPG
jgi:hypothetical protein